MPTAVAETPLRLLLTDGSRVALAIGAVGRDWVAGELVRESATTSSCVVPIAAIAACFPDAAQSAAGIAPDIQGGSGVASLASRLGLPFVLRDLCRRRAALHITTPREQLHGTIDRVGRDHVDLAEHEHGLPRRGSAVTAVRMLPLTQIVQLRF